MDDEPKVLVLVRDEEGRPVRWIEGPAALGLHRVAWDLRRPAPDPVDFSTPDFTPPWVTPPRGPLAPPGRYSAELYLVDDEGISPLASPREFEVMPLPTTPPGADLSALTAFQHETADLSRRVSAAGGRLGEARERLRHMRAALLRTPRADTACRPAVDDGSARATAGRSCRHRSSRASRAPPDSGT